MEQITNYFEHMDYVSFGVIALPCVVIAVYGFLQVASGLAKGKNDKMQEQCNPNNNNNNHNNNANANATNGNSNQSNCGNTGGNNNFNNGNSSGSKRCPGKYSNNNMSAYNNSNNNGNSKNASRKNRYNNNNQNQHQNPHQKQQQRNFYGNSQKRIDGAAGDMDANLNGESQAQSWRNYSGHHLANSSCIEDKFLGQHNPAHRNSTSSETTSEDICSSREQIHKPKGAHNNASNGGSNGSKTHSKRQQKGRNSGQQQQQQQQEQSGQSKAAAGVAGAVGFNKAKQQASAGKWRQQQSQQQPSQQLQQQQQKRGNNKKQQQQQQGNNKWCNSNNSSNGANNTAAGRNVNMSKPNGSSNRNVAKHLANSCGSSSFSSSSSALSSSAGSSPNSSPYANGNRKRAGAAGNDQWRHYNNNNNNNNKSSNNKNLLQQGEMNVNFLVPPLRQREQLKMDDQEVIERLRPHLIDQHLLRVYGFPVESVVHEGAIEIFKCMPNMNMAAARLMSLTLEREREREMQYRELAPPPVINYDDGLPTEESQAAAEAAASKCFTVSTDSGNSSPSSLDSESGEWSGSECGESSSAGACRPEMKYYQYANSFHAHVDRSLSKPCARCKRHFLVDELTGEYLTREECVYHEGKYNRFYDGTYVGRWTCCNATDEAAEGCVQGELHVWTGSAVGVNGPYYDFVRTQPAPGGCHFGHTPSVYALDCEMSYTGRGLDVTKVSLVALNGQLVYEHFVRPDCDIIDYNTRYSGITEKDLRSGNVKTLAEVQRDLMQLISADTILIGHALDNDLRALRIVHHTLIDTSITFPHGSGFPFRRALRLLTKYHLHREIQCGDGTTGHSSFEDSRACMDLMLWRVRRELDPTWRWQG
ncbi:probable serine/threonine-protein kinase DDB_G0267686 isoform X2 [Drosophila subobscura]|uniref:probable serine/threonine-protein kinase DDB_G0267686 isoform X2 n=1 Tax=Drosophila subobscura TaxID=7241 RepID=UPI00155AA54D|nr:probable serine/threonine-protein kinase DDB_G0267686 isoform X2 [Drosophila subobscura]